jgi:adenosylcobinamide-GDP ribazoletransferase
MFAFFSAIRFLTVIPVPLSWCGDEQSFNKSPDWYPLAGLAIGLFMAAGDLLLRWLLPLPVATVLVMLGLIAISGALHMDGLADTADAFFSSRGRERMLEIMKDSSAGPMGVTAIVVVLLLKTALLISLPPQWRTETIILMPLAGRCVMPIISSWLSYARSTEGTGAFIQNGSGFRRFALSLGAMTLFSISLLGWGTGLLVVVVFSLSTWLMGRYSRRKIGGYTGDILGATCELIEMVPAFCVIILAHQGVI